MIRKLILFTVFFLFVVALADFHRWVNQVGALRPEDPLRADAIVALTGGSGHRIEAALSILEDGAGQRLLVSGVHESVNISELIATTGGQQSLYDCCIDIGREADSTQGNAIETREWVDTHDYNSLIIVTSDYHMPRALLWFRKELGTTHLIPYPVESGIRPRQWWRSWTSIRGLVLEWSKYRVTAAMKDVLS